MFDKYLDKEIYRVLLFTLVVLIVSYFANYFEILFYRPQSIHFTRQTDSLSFVVNYFQNGMHFFSPQTFNLTTVNGNAACEFPILYYITAILYFIFGEHEFFLRLINILIVFTGLYYAFKAANMFLHDWVLSYLVIFLVFSSTVVLYYANNFLPDSAALGFSLIGLYHFVKYAFKNNNKCLIFSFVFLTLAGLLKATYMIFPLVIIGLFIIEKIGVKLSDEKIFANIKLFIILSISSFTIVFSWYYYAINYNTINGDFYFLTSTTPIWELSKDTIKSTLNIIHKYWKIDYFSYYTFYFIYISIAVSLLLIKWSNRLLRIFLFFLIIGTASYFILFFEKFRDHDYYILLVFPLVLFLFINTIASIKKIFNSKYILYVLYVILFVLVYESNETAINNQNKRYLNRSSSNYIYNNFNDIRPKLDSLNISDNQIFIVVGDSTRNGSLYFLKKRGWTIADTSEISLQAFNNALKTNPDYLIITEDYFLKNKAIRDIKKQIVFTHNGMEVFSLNE